MNVIGIIPARMAATRFPGKPLAQILGVPMVGHVYHRACMCEHLDAVYIATCDAEIRAYAESIGAPCIMTAHTHQRATERAAEAVDIIEAQTGEKVDVVMMVQGDEPMLKPRMLSQAVLPLIENSNLNVANLMAVIENEDDFLDPNEIKVVVDSKDRALYFSREPIPCRARSSIRTVRHKQFGLIAFRRDYLSVFLALPPTPLELAESIDMLRVLEHGGVVQMVLTEDVSVGVDTPDDLASVQDVMANDPLVKRYV